MGILKWFGLVSKRELSKALSEKELEYSQYMAEMKRTLRTNYDIQTEEIKKKLSAEKRKADRFYSRNHRTLKFLEEHDLLNKRIISVHFIEKIKDILEGGKIKNE